MKKTIRIILVGVALVMGFMVAPSISQAVPSAAFILLNEDECLFRVSAISDSGGTAVIALPFETDFDIKRRARSRVRIKIDVSDREARIEGPSLGERQELEDNINQFGGFVVLDVTSQKIMVENKKSAGQKVKIVI